MPDRKNSRVGLKDIAADLGISTTAASFALNDKPGVSEETKRRVRDAADRLGWSPVYAAQALSSSKTMTVGFAPSQGRTNFQNESFMLHFMAGIHLSLSRERYGLLFRPSTSLEEEVGIYEDWASRKRVDGVVLTDLRADDPRPRVLSELGIPAVLAGGPDPDNLVPSLSLDDSATMRLILDHLTDQGHRRIAYFSGNSALNYSRVRTEVLGDYADSHGLDSAAAHYTNFDPEVASSLTCSMLATDEAPTALIYENETMAASSLRALMKLYFSDSPLQMAEATEPPGPDELAGIVGQSRPYPEGLPAIVSFEDSFVCTATFPSITAVHRDPMEYGQRVANLLISRLGDEDMDETQQVLPSQLIVRESSLTPVSLSA